MVIVVEVDFETEQFVYLKTDPDQQRRMVTAIVREIGGAVKYRLGCGTEVSEHFAAEIEAAQ